MFQRILVAVDGSDAAKRAVKTAAELAVKAYAAVQLVNVVSPPVPFGLAPIPEALELEGKLFQAGWQMLAEMRKLIPSGINVEDKVLEGRPADEIIAQAKNWQADLVVVGDHNQHLLSRFLLGSTADAVVRHAPCPVLVVRKQVREPSTCKKCEATERTVAAPAEAGTA
jgi:nucleotide-binding universal stress UspA family protein